MAMAQTEETEQAETPARPPSASKSGALQGPGGVKPEGQL